MPAQTANVGLDKLVGAQGVKAWEATKDAKPKDVGGELPAGIENGVAKIKVLKIGLFSKGDHKGQPFFMGQAVVLSPDEHVDTDTKNKVKCAGRQIATRPLPICETKDFNGNAISFQESWQTFTDVLKRLGVRDPKLLHPATVEATMATLVKAGVTFNFRTYRRKKDKESDPLNKVTVLWGDVCKYNGQAAAPPVNDQSATPTAEAPAEAPAETAPETETTTEASGDVDLDAMAVEAYNNEDVQGQLVALAVGLGIDEGWVNDTDDNGAKTWEQVVAAIREKQGEGSAPAADTPPAEDWKPVKDAICFYKPKGAKRAVEVKIVSVSKDRKSVELVKASDAKVKYSKVAVSELEHD